MIKINDVPFLFLIMDEEGVVLSKGILNASLYMENEGIFRCPLCLGQMKLFQLKSLICTNQHCFDLSKYGYVNLLTHALHSKYDKKMFQSRREVFEKNFFSLLNFKISEIILSSIKSSDKQIKILDAGCGEGSSLSEIVGGMNRQLEEETLGVGLDIAKEGVSMASKRFKNMLWCVGDLAKAPFADQQFNYILNILAPANYIEFKRMLADDGRVIKVIPEEGYLKELREILFNRPEQQSYSNDNTFELFKSNFNLCAAERVHYLINIDYTWLEALLYMTPLSWGAGRENILKALDKKIEQVTVDLTILIGS